MPVLNVKRTRNGKGIFTTKSFKSGQIICEIRGNLIRAEKEMELWKTNPKKAENMFRYCPTRYLSPEGELGDYSNHSCNPNAGVIKKQGRLFWVAIRNINKDEEILIDYSTILGADDIWTMKCNCGEKECRKIIKRIDKIPKKVFIRYKKLGIIPKYILKTMK